MSQHRKHRGMLVSDYQSGMTLQEAADNHGVSLTTAHRWMRAEGAQVRPATKRDGLDEAVALDATTGDRCNVEDCVRLPHARGLCRAHYERARRRNLFDAMRGPVSTYSGIHNHLRRKHGAAAGRPCTQCGTPAAAWAYDHSDPDELTHLHANGCSVPYSLDCTRYQPLCSSCHYFLDRPYLEKPNV